MELPLLTDCWPSLSQAIGCVIGLIVACITSTVPEAKFIIEVVEFGKTSTVGHYVVKVSAFLV